MANPTNREERDGVSTVEITENGVKNREMKKPEQNKRHGVDE